MRQVLFSLCVTFMSGTVLCADAPMRQISVVGEGRASAAPDLAMITLGARQEAETAAVAMRETSAAVALILGRLEDAGLQTRDIQTRAISLTPQYENRRYDDNASPKILGFVASNTLDVRVSDLTLLGGVLDDVLEEGANTVSGLRFSVQNPKPLLDEARRRAVADGLDRAALLAEGAGVVLGPVQTINDVGRDRGPAVMMEMARAESVPVAAGEISFSASVSMVFEIVEKR